MGKYLALVLKGMAYGITHIIPGLGGALVLILLGIYEQFVEAVGNLFIQRKRWKQYLSFLVPLGIGMGLGMIGLAKIISLLSGRFPAVMSFFFMGLVVGTIPSVLRLHGDMRPTVGRALAFLGGLALVIVTRLIDTQNNPTGVAVDITTTPGLIYNTVASFLAGCASVTPGLDGSYVLLLTRVYEPVINTLGRAPEMLVKLAQLQWDPNWWTLVTLLIGAVAGILLFSKLVDTAIKRAPSVTYYGVLGLVTGSIYGLWPTEPASTPIAIHILVFIIGAVAAFYFGRSQIKEVATQERDAALPS